MQKVANPILLCDWLQRFIFKPINYFDWVKNEKTILLVSFIWRHSQSGFDETLVFWWLNIKQADIEKWSRRRLICCVKTTILEWFKQVRHCVSILVLVLFIIVTFKSNIGIKFCVINGKNLWRIWLINRACWNKNVLVVMVEWFISICYFEY